MGKTAKLLVVRADAVRVGDLLTFGEGWSPMRVTGVSQVDSTNNVTIWTKVDGAQTSWYIPRYHIVAVERA